ncbi:MAG: malate dehydrogenase [Phycisphaerales bacterium]|nr:malate dehydrogenase [Phycisphaerales bacterium]
MKVTIVGAGAVGAACAENIAKKNVCSDLILLDIKEGLSEGKAQDIMQTAYLNGFNTRITGVTNNFQATAHSDIVVVTSGIPRKPGMTREELIGTNAGIVKGVCLNILKESPNAIFIIVSNPMDTMAYLALHETKLPKNRIIGMGGQLDSSRFKYQISQRLQCNPRDLNAIVIGGHGDTTMIPLLRLATWNSIPVTQFLSAEQQTQIINDTMVGGATLTKLLGTSAWAAPGAAVSTLVEAIALDTKSLIPCCVSLNGEFGQKDICLGVPVVLGRNGWDKIVEIPLSNDEATAFKKSADAVRNMNEVLQTVVK